MNVPPGATFSEGALHELTTALANYLDSGDSSRHEILERAMWRLCTEAHQQHLRPEQMIIEIKKVWARNPALDRMHESRAGVAWDRVVSACLQAYYAESGSEVS